MSLELHVQKSGLGGLVSKVMGLMHFSVNHCVSSETAA